uniref:Uncharacterized protein n=1 Tax=Anguilla anguilla TaxID=7936 RepID=A0A0E9R2M9_ANGAN
MSSPWPHHHPIVACVIFQ